MLRLSLASFFAFPFCISAALQTCPAPKCPELDERSCKFFRAYCFWAVKEYQRSDTGKCLTISEINCSQVANQCNSFRLREKCAEIRYFDKCVDRNRFQCSPLSEWRCDRVGPSLCFWDQVNQQCRKTSEVPCENYLDPRDCNDYWNQQKCQWSSDESKCTDTRRMGLHLNFSTLRHGDSSGIKNTRHVVFNGRKRGAMEYFWRLFHAHTSPVPRMPNIGGYGRLSSALVGVFLKRPTSGYTVTIKSVELRRVVTVLYEVKEPSPDLILQNVTAYPFHLVLVHGASYKHVRFLNVKDVAKEKEVPFTSIEKGDTSGITFPRKVVIRNAEGFELLWSKHKHKALPSSVQPVPTIDFSKYMVLGAFQSLEYRNREEPWSHYSVEIKSIKEGPDSVMVKYDTSEADSETSCDQPFHLVQMKKTDKRVEFARI